MYVETKSVPECSFCSLFFCFADFGVLIPKQQSLKDFLFHHQMETDGETEPFKKGFMFAICAMKSRLKQKVEAVQFFCLF